MHNAKYNLRIQNEKYAGGLYIPNMLNGLKLALMDEL